MSTLEPREVEQDIPIPGERQDAGQVPGVLGRAYRAMTVGIVTVVLLIAFEATAVGTAMPVAARELDGVGMYAYAFSGYFTTSLLAMVVAGLWADRRGPLGPMTWGIGVWAAGLVLAGAAGAMWVFVVGRAVQGLGGGLVIVALYVVVGRAYPERLRPAIMSAFAAAWVVPSVVGPLVAGLVTERVGWRWVFLGIPVLVVLPLLLALPATRRAVAGPVEGKGEERKGERKGEDGRRVRLAGGIALGAGLLQYAGQRLDAVGALVALAGLGVLVPSVLGLLPPGTYRARRGLPSVVLLRGLGAGAFIASESFIPLMLVTQRGLSPTLAGLSLAAGGGSWALGSYTQSRPRLEPHRRRLTMAGMALVASAIATAPTVLVQAVPVWVVAVAWGVGCYGMGLALTSTSVLMLRLSAPEETGANSAALQISDALTTALLLAAGGAAFAALGGGAVGAAHEVGEVTNAGAFVAVFGPMALVAVLGIWVAGRILPAEGAKVGEEQHG